MDYNNLKYLQTFFNFYNSLVFFDFETSGFSPIDDDIIEIGAIQAKKKNDGLIFKELNVLVKLNKKDHLPDKITEITGITESMLLESGIDIDDARDQLFELIAEEKKTLLIAHNASFDLRFLYYLFLTNEHQHVLQQFDILDTLTVLRDRKAYPHKLSDGILFYGLTGIVKNSHRALEDVYSLLYLVDAMEKEKQDVFQYVNLIGYIPKYPIRSFVGYNKIELIPQSYDSRSPVYEKRKSVA